MIPSVIFSLLIWPVQDAASQPEPPSPEEAMQCFLQLAGSALSVQDNCSASKALALSRVADMGHACGLLDADSATACCHISTLLTSSAVCTAAASACVLAQTAVM